MSKEKTYLKWYNKVGYGSGDVAGNVVYALLTSFVMIYLTDTIGLNAGVIGVLIAVSKIFDGITDIIFGTLIDKTHTKMGKAKPWMLYGFIGCAITLIGVFAIPMNMDNFAQYAWFFICYKCILYGKQHRIFCSDRSCYKEQQGKSSDGFLSFYLRIWNKPPDSGCYIPIC